MSYVSNIPPRCYECGRPISDEYLLFSAICSQLIGMDHKMHIDSAIINTGDTVSFEAAFQVLGIPRDKTCCRKILLCSYTQEDLAIMGSTSADSFTGVVSPFGSSKIFKP